MKNSAIVMMAFIAGAVASAFAFPFLYELADTDPPLSATVLEAHTGRMYSESSGSMSFPATGITLSEGYEMFQNYHQSSTLAGSIGCLRVNFENSDSALVAVFLGEQELIGALREKALRDNKEFIGLAGLPAKRTDNESNTMIWMAVINESGKPRLYLPPANSQATDYIYEYIDVCPKDCPDDWPRLWNENWQ